MIAWCVAVAVSIYTNHYTPIWWITAECDTPRTGLLLAEHSQPEWDGIHGRWISLLPRQNQFTPLDNHFPLLELLPPKLVKESIDVDKHTKVLVGVASDHTPAKVVHGGKLIRAGEPVYLRIVPDSEKKTYDLTVVDGTAVSHEHVLFSEEWASPRDHRQKADQLQRKIRKL